MEETILLPCVNGVFTLPPTLFRKLEQSAPKGIVYFRHADDSLMISGQWLSDARRKQLRPRYRARFYQDVTKLAVLELGEMLAFMPVEWRAPRPQRDQDPA